MNPYIQLVIGCFGLSLVLTYAMWLHSRVWILRQDLFSIRDDLWMKMHKKNLLDHPAHREARSAINSMIRFAPLFNLFTLVVVLTSGLAFSRPRFDEIDECSEAVNSVSRRVLHYAIYQTLTGWLLMILAKVAAIRKLVTDKLGEWVDRVIKSDEFKGGGGLSTT